MTRDELREMDLDLSELTEELRNIKKLMQISIRREIISEIRRTHFHKIDSETDLGRDNYLDKLHTLLKEVESV